MKKLSNAIEKCLWGIISAVVLEVTDASSGPFHSPESLKRRQYAQHTAWSKSSYE
jgi:hypothetical protein